MRFLIDENLSWRLAKFVNKAGHDDRAIVSADTDFGALLAYARATKPSVVLVRALVDRRPLELAGIIIANLDSVAHHLDAGAVADETPNGALGPTVLTATRRGLTHQPGLPDAGSSPRRRWPSGTPACARNPRAAAPAR